MFRKLNSHDFYLKKVEEEIIPEPKPEENKAKPGEEGYLRHGHAVHIIDPDKLCGYKIMHPDGSIEDYDDYGSATAHPDLGAGSSVLGNVYEQRKFMEEQDKIKNVQEPGEGGGHNRRGVHAPEKIHAYTKAQVDVAVQNYQSSLTNRR